MENQTEIRICSFKIETCHLCSGRGGMYNFQDENYLEFIFEDGKYYSATIFGNGDFTHHQANFEFIK